MYFREFPDGATVSQIIEELSKLPSNLKVVGTWESIQVPVWSIKVMKADDEESTGECIVILDVDHSLSSPD